MNARWFLTVWVEDDDVMEDTIPSRWVDEIKRVVYWPRSGAPSKMREHAQPDHTTWLKFPLTKVKHRSAKKWDCVRYSETDTKSDHPQQNKRPAVSSEDDEYPPPPPPPKKFRYAKTTNTPRSKSPDQVNETPVTPRSCTPERMSTASPTLGVSTPIELTTIGCSQDDDDQSATKGDLRRAQERNEKMTKKIIAAILTLKTAVETMGAERRVLSGTILPTLSTVDEVVEYNPENREAVVAQMVRVGGMDIRSSIAGLMNSTLTNDVMAQLNGYGKGGSSKTAFFDTNLYRMIKEAVRERFESSDDAAINARIMVHLRHAPARLRNEQRRENKDMGPPAPVLYS